MSGAAGPVRASSADDMSLSAARLQGSDPEQTRYIKLGIGGAWAQEAISRGIVPLKFRNVPHDLCADGNWDAVRSHLAAAGDRSVSDTVRELQAFYEFDDCLWVTIADGHLWWAFGTGKVIATNDPDPSRPVRYRETLDGWHCRDLAGGTLELHRLSSALTKVYSYQRTICTVPALPYLLRKLRAEDDSLVAETLRTQATLEHQAAELISGLHQRDFEILIDLIFAQGGWQRLTAVGSGEIDFDMLLINRTLGERAWVQVKSKANQAVLDDYLARYRRHGTAERFYFACHSPQGKLTLPAEPGLHLWSGAELARLVISAGLLDWLIDHSG